MNDDDIGTVLLVFLLLKLTGTVGWSWWWVVSPIIFALIMAVHNVLLWIGIRWAENLHEQIKEFNGAGKDK